jgi:hypothetical protein
LMALMNKLHKLSYNVSIWKSNDFIPTLMIKI